MVNMMHPVRPKSVRYSGTWPRTGYSPIGGPPAAYAARMRRTAQLAVDISTTLADAGLEISARRLEGWTGDGLGPDERLPIAEQLGHYRALATVARTGPGTERGRGGSAAGRSRVRLSTLAGRAPSRMQRRRGRPARGSA